MPEPLQFGFFVNADEFYVMRIQLSFQRVKKGFGGNDSETVATAGVKSQRNVVIGSDNGIVAVKFLNFVPVMGINDLNAFSGQLSKGNAVFDNSFQITVKIGIESFDDDFRNKFLNKGIYFENVEKLKRSFDSPCLMVGIKGQTKQMISKDIEILTNNFDYGTINIYTNNSTNIKRDDSLVSWFYENYSYLKDDPRYDFLDVNTDFGVGN